MRLLKKILLNVLAVLLSMNFIFPALWLIFSAFKPKDELFSYPLRLFPQNPTLANFFEVWERVDFGLYTKNTLFVTVTATVFTIVMSTACGFALAKYKQKWLTVLFVALLSTTMLPQEVIMIPLFEVIFRMGLYNSLGGLIIPVLSTLTGVFMMRQFFMSVPDSLMEAARIDGASELNILVKIMFPLAMPIISILTIFSFRWRWNDYMLPLIVIDDPEKFTLQLALRNFIGEDSIAWSALLAATVLVTIPLVIIFLLFQKFIMNNALNSGIK